MKKKMINLSVMLLVIAVLLIGCVQQESTQGGKTSNDNKIVVGFSLGTIKEERWQREIEMAKKFAKEHNFELVVQSAEEDASKQVKQVENMVTQGIDVLIISAQDSESAGAVVDIAHRAGVPVIAYDRLVRNGDLDYYVTFDTVKVGELQAQGLVQKYPKGNYIWLLGGPEDFNAYLLKEGQEKVLKPLIQKGDIKIVTQQWCKGWSPEEALKHTENGLTAANNNVVAVLASNDNTAGGAVQALEAQGLAGKVGVSGQDADLAAVQRIVEGKQTMTIYKPIKVLNQKVMELAYALAKGEKEKVNSMVNGKVNNGTKDVPSVVVDVVNVTKENVVDTVIKDGFHKIEDVYKNIPKNEWPKQ
ncbi:sugar ABC transporter substrate-binding protein [Aeribacillus composti]|jgi:D-xylose transport system substrate-binding protein|uniref:sugar ABC transporter substrate-binding protein n=1 Tax=Aeribacillus composti TaxID=1868734 RepID=UPI00406A56D4